MTDNRYVQDTPTGPEAPRFGAEGGGGRRDLSTPNSPLIRSYIRTDLAGTGDVTEHHLLVVAYNHDGYVHIHGDALIPLIRAAGYTLADNQEGLPPSLRSVANECPRCRLCSQHDDVVDVEIRDDETTTDPTPDPTSPPVHIDTPMRETAPRVGFRTNGGYWHTDV